MYEVKTKQYSGPLEKLLSLIEEQKLDITEVSLAAVTADFIDYVKQLESEIPHAALADFLVIAARLVLIKSKVLLPALPLTEDEQADIKDLEARLKIYQEFKRAGEGLMHLWKQRAVLHSRPLFLGVAETGIFYPPPKLSAQDMIASIKTLTELFTVFTAETKTIRTRVVTLEEKVTELLERFKTAASQSFRTLSGSRTKEEVIVLFLAILHLFRHQTFALEQQEKFGDILISKPQGL